MNQLVYIFVAQVLIALMLSAILFLCWLKVDRKPHALSWALAFAVITVSYGLNIARDLMPHPVYWAIVNALSLTSISLAFGGFWQRAGRKPRPGLLIGAIIVVETLVIWFRSVYEHIGLTMAFVPYFSMVAMFASAAVLLTQGRRLKAAEWGMVIVVTVFGVAQGAAATVALQQGPAGDLEIREVYNQINFLTMPAAFAGLGLFAVFIIASDLADAMRELALTDSLTGLTNRRGFWDAAERARSEAARTGEPLCIALADIDRFKRVNDTHGHPVGDEVLAAMAQRLSSGLRASDLLARVGGEEFAFLLPRTKLSDAVAICERQLECVTASPIEVSGLELPITCSFGVSAVDPADSMRSAIATMDEALYRAKTNGRNRVEASAAPQ